jgi:hypothetical protein
MLVTYKDLEDKRACKKGIEFFKKEFPNGVETNDLQNTTIEAIGSYKYYEWFIEQYRISCILKGSDDYWAKWEYDKNGNETYWVDSDGYWRKREYDGKGNNIKMGIKPIGKNGFTYI